MIGIVLPVADDRILSALCLQKCKDFRVYVSGGEPEEEGSSLDLVHGSWSQVQEPYTVILESGAVPDPSFVKRIEASIGRHPGFDVYHVNIRGEKPFPRKMSAKKLFLASFVEGRPAPLSSFVFSTGKLRASAIFRADGNLAAIPTVLSTTGTNPVRNVWRGLLDYEAPAAPGSEKAAEEAIRQKLDDLRFSEGFFTDKDYPMTVGDQMDFFAGEIAKLYPSYSEEDLRELFDDFEIAKGSVRRLRAHNALKKAIKERKEKLQ